MMAYVVTMQYNGEKEIIGVGSTLGNAQTIGEKEINALAFTAKRFYWTSDYDRVVRLNRAGKEFIVKIQEMQMDL